MEQTPRVQAMINRLVLLGPQQRNDGLGMWTSEACVHRREGKRRKRRLIESAGTFVSRLFLVLRLSLALDLRWSHSLTLLGLLYHIERIRGQGRCGPPLLRVSAPLFLPPSKTSIGACLCRDQVCWREPDSILRYLGYLAFHTTEPPVIFSAPYTPLFWDTRDSNCIGLSRENKLRDKLVLPVHQVIELRKRF